MFLTLAVLLLALSANNFFIARTAARRRAYRQLFINAIAATVFLVGAGFVARYGFQRPDALMPDPRSNCTTGLGASAFVCGPSHAKPETSQTAPSK